MAKTQYGTNKIKKITAAAAFVSVFALFVCGCGAKKPSDTQLSISKDGVITSSLAEHFDKEYYSLSELEDMAADEISYYNSEYSSPKINLLQSEVSEDGNVLLSISYNSYIDYAHFNQLTFYYGTVADAADKGFSVAGDLVDSKGETISFDNVDDISDRHIIITGDKVTIAAPYNISYMTKGVVLKDKKEADLSGVSTDIVQLLLSK